MIASEPALRLSTGSCYFYYAGDSLFCGCGDLDDEDEEASMRGLLLLTPLWFCKLKVISLLFEAAVDTFPG